MSGRACVRILELTILPELRVSESEYADIVSVSWWTVSVRKIML